MNSSKACCEKRVYTVNEIKTILNIGKNQAYELIKKNIFYSVQFCGTIRVSKKSFDEWYKKKKEN